MTSGDVAALYHHSIFLNTLQAAMPAAAIISNCLEADVARYCAVVARAVVARAVV